MFRNYILTAWRNLIKNKTHAAINIAGLSVGMAVAMLIGLWIWDELSFDKYHQNYDNIAQVMEQKTTSGRISTDKSIERPLELALRKNYDNNFKHIVMASWPSAHLLAADDKTISYSGNFMGAEAPDMFSLKMLKGSHNGLQDPSSILISSSVAVAMFGNTEPLGKLIKLDNAASFKVTGVYEDLPKNTSLHYLAFIAPWDYFVTSQDWVQKAITDWGESAFQMYVQLQPNADMQKVSSAIQNIKQKNISSEEAKYKPHYFLQPMNKWHLYSQFKNGVNSGAIEYVWIFGITGMFVLLLACINFMNLSTARSEKRAKEVGIRKAIGSLRTQLIKQFFCESLLMAAFAFCIALLLATITLPFFNALADKDMFILWANPFFWIVCIVFTFLTGTLAGMYPALYLSSFNPVKILKGSFKAGKAATVPRSILVTSQFAVSIILIIGAIVVFKQVQFAKNRPVGYNRDGLINLQTLGTTDLQKHFTLFEQDLHASGAIAAVAEASSPMTQIQNNRADLTWKEKDANLTYSFANIRVSSGYGKAAGWQLLEGRDFSTQLLTDSSAIIINEAAVKYMGLAHPLNEIVRFNNKDFTIIGVVKDMIMNSAYEPAKQTIFYLSPDGFDDMIVRINPASPTREALDKISAVCKKYSPSVPFTYKFVDEDYARKFSTEERIGKLAGVFTVLAIFISCLGLFGMASFMAEQRTKEIGVRKILGATVFNLWKLLSKEFVILVLISLLIALPAAYYFMHKWLQGYNYRTELSWWIFATAGIGALAITLITVSYQSIKAALANPVKSLRTE